MLKLSTTNLFASSIFLTHHHGDYIKQGPMKHWVKFNQSAVIVHMSLVSILVPLWLTLLIKAVKVSVFNLAVTKHIRVFVQSKPDLTLSVAQEVMQASLIMLILPSKVTLNYRNGHLRKLLIAGLLVLVIILLSVQSLSHAQLCNPMNCSTSGLPVHHQTHVHWIGDANQPSHPLSSPSSPALNLSQHQCLF